MPPIRTALRTGLSGLTRRLPRMRGLGRCILAIDRWLTERSDAESHQVIAHINVHCRLKVDLRVLEQKFAYYYGEWESELLAAAVRHFRGGAFYDIGGSIGLYAVTLGRHCRDHGGYVRTVEPAPANLVRLRQNLDLNGLNGQFVTIDERGLSDRCGSFHVALVAEGVPGNAKVVQQGGSEVTVTTLDDLWTESGNEPVGFVKIDTEGHDALILRGGIELLRSCRPNLLVEFNRERMRNLKLDVADSWNLLTGELGYRGYVIDGKSKERRIEDPGNAENLLFLHEGGINARA